MTLRVPKQAEPVKRKRDRATIAATKTKKGIIPLACKSGSTMCSCAFSNTCCPDGVVCGCPLGFAKCE